MRSGALRHKIKIEQRTRVSDGGGGFENGWETFQDNLNARIVQKSGSEAVTGDTLAGVLTHEVFVRESSRTRKITNLMRIVEKRTGTIHNIKAIWPDERDRVIKIVTQTGSRDG